MWPEAGIAPDATAIGSSEQGRGRGCGSRVADPKPSSPTAASHLDGAFVNLDLAVWRSPTSCQRPKDAAKRCSSPQMPLGTLSEPGPSPNTHACCSVCMPLTVEVAGPQVPRPGPVLWSLPPFPELDRHQSILAWAGSCMSLCTLSWP